MMSLVSHERKRALSIAAIGLSLQIPLALWLNYLMTVLWAGSEPFFYGWQEFTFIAAVAFLVQWWRFRSPRGAQHRFGKWVWLPVFWILAFIEIMAL